MIRAVLFDLDGTLADTAPDLTYALNLLLAEAGRPPLTLGEVRPVASHGSPALLRLGFGITTEHPHYEPLRARLLALYRANIARETTLFPGMAALIDHIEASGRRLGVVTNKPAFLTGPLIAELGLAERLATVVSGDTLPEHKPHPAPMLLASREARCEPAQCVYLGDAERDILAGRNAGMTTVLAGWGYLAAEDRPHEWGADLAIDQPEGLIPWLEGKVAGAGGANAA